MTILVTGATGHIGNVLVRQLCEAGEKVRALVLAQEDRKPIAGLPVECVEGDILDPASLRSACQGVDLLYHLAGVISILPGPEYKMRQVNVQGTQNILEAANAGSVRRVVYTSSIHAIRRAPVGVEIDETQPFDPDNPVGAYDRSKAEATLAVLEAARRGQDAVVTCPTGVIGPYDFRLSEVGSIIHSCVQRKLQLYIDGAYDFVDVRDVANGLRQAASQGKSGETYILSGERLTVRGLLDTIKDATGQNFARLRIPMGLARLVAQVMPWYYRQARVKPRLTPYSLETLKSNSQISHAKATRELGYTPRPVSESVADMVRWLRER